MSDKFIVVGDLHLGMKAFNDEFLDNQLKFFHEQLFPFMKEHKIDTIVQLGDLLDNRKIMNIKTFDRINKELFEPMAEMGFKMITILGNHDIYYSSTLDINLVQYFEKLHPETVTVFTEPSIIEIGSYKYKLFPWLIDKQISAHELSGADVVFGHFEIKNFEMVKGHVDDKSELSSKFFQKAKGLKKVVSGHYHVQSSDGFVMYAGTPYQMNWGDYQTSRGFFVFDGHEYDYHENVVSSKFVKIKYNDSKEQSIELSGYYDENRFFSSVTEMPDLSHHFVKFFINEAKDKEYETISFDLHQTGVEFDVINNVEISDLIGTDFQGEIDNIGGAELLLQTVKDKKPHLLSLLDKIMSEIDE
jgi:DNA repair exonuclease SbcCD nuclease subunit